MVYTALGLQLGFTGECNNYQIKCLHSMLRFTVYKMGHWTRGFYGLSGSSVQGVGCRIKYPLALNESHASQVLYMENMLRAAICFF